MKKSYLTYCVVAVGGLILLAVFFFSRQDIDDNNNETKETVTGVSIDKANFPDDVFRTYLLGLDFGKDSILTIEEQKKIDELSIPVSGIRSLQGIEHFPYLGGLRMSSQMLGQLTMPRMEELYRLYCIDCQLTWLDVSQCSNLVELKCSKNKITKLDVSHLSRLEQLYADENLLTEIMMEGTDSLFILDVHQNMFTKLDLSTQKNLHCVFLGDNPMNDTQLNTFLTTLPEGVKLDTSWSDHVMFEDPYVSLGNRTLTDAQKQMMEKKGWTRSYDEE